MDRLIKLFDVADSQYKLVTNLRRGHDLAVLICTVVHQQFLNGLKEEYGDLPPLLLMNKFYEDIKDADLRVDFQKFFHRMQSVASKKEVEELNAALDKVDVDWETLFNGGEQSADENSDDGGWGA